MAVVEAVEEAVAVVEAVEVAVEEAVAVADGVAHTASDDAVQAAVVAPGQVEHGEQLPAPTALEKKPDAHGVQADDVPGEGPLPTVE